MPPMSDADSASRGLDPNRPPRRRCELAAELSFSDGTFLPARVIDLSDSGAFVEVAPNAEFADEGTLLIDTAPLPATPGPDEATPPAAPRPSPSPAASSPARDATRLPVAVSIVRMGTHHEAVDDDRVGALTVARQGLGLQFLRVDSATAARLRALLDALDER